MCVVFDVVVVGPFRYLFFFSSFLYRLRFCLLLRFFFSIFGCFVLSFVSFFSIIFWFVCCYFFRRLSIALSFVSVLLLSADICYIWLQHEELIILLYLFIMFCGILKLKIAFRSTLFYFVLFVTFFSSIFDCILHIELYSFFILFLKTQIGYWFVDLPLLFIDIFLFTFCCCVQFFFLLNRSALLFILSSCS